MIPATAAYVARYVNPATATTGKHWHSKPIVAWDDEGRPLVIASDGSRLIHASSFSNFSGVLEADPVYVGMIPGGGWLIEYANPDGSTTTGPVVAWALRADGELTPLDTDADGVFMGPGDWSTNYKIYHPDAFETAAPEAAKDDQ